MDLLDYIPESYTDLLREELAKYTKTGDNPRHDIIQGGLEKNQKLMLAVFTILGLAGIFYNFFKKDKKSQEETRESEYKKINVEAYRIYDSIIPNIFCFFDINDIIKYKSVFMENIGNYKEFIKKIINNSKNDFSTYEYKENISKETIRKFLDCSDDNYNFLNFYNIMSLCTNLPDNKIDFDFIKKLIENVETLLENECNYTYQIEFSDPHKPEDREEKIKKAILNIQKQMILNKYLIVDDVMKFLDDVFQFFNFVSEDVSNKIIEFARKDKYNFATILIGTRDYENNVTALNSIGFDIDFIQEIKKKLLDNLSSVEETEKLDEAVDKYKTEFPEKSGGYNFQIFMVIIIVVIILLIFIISDFLKKNDESFKIELNKFI